MILFYTTLSLKLARKSFDFVEFCEHYKEYNTAKNGMVSAQLCCGGMKYYVH